MKDEFFLVTQFNGECAIAQEIFDDLEKARKFVRELSINMEPGDRLEFDNCNKHGEVY